jgi:hypothetical protein
MIAYSHVLGIGTRPLAVNERDQTDSEEKRSEDAHGVDDR